jgi:hypothetical protein
MMAFLVTLATSFAEMIAATINAPTMRMAMFLAEESVRASMRPRYADACGETRHCPDAEVVVLTHE